MSSTPPPPPEGPTRAASEGAADAGARVWTILEVVRWTQARFTERGIPSARLDAELLAAQAFGLARIALYAQFDRPLLPHEQAAYRELVKRRLGGEPVAYITGRKEFWSLDLAVDARVLIPRPDTETAVQAVLDLEAVVSHRKRRRGRSAALAEARRENEGGEGVSENDGSAGMAVTDHSLAAQALANSSAGTRARSAHDLVPAPAPTGGTLRLVDIGTGSGAIALALKKELPDAEVHAVDLSDGALTVARANAGQLGLAVTFHEGALTEPLQDCGRFDVIVSNLPYIPTADIAGLAPEVRREPKLALDGGADGLDLVRQLVDQARAKLVSGGALVLEIGDGQAEATATLCRQAGYASVSTARDLGDIERVVIARTPGASA